MSVLDLNTLQTGINRVFPDEATIAAVQSILEHPQIVDSLNQAIKETIALRKAHLDEIASTVTLPVDDTNDLSVQVRRLITSPLFGWAEASRRFISRLVVALQSVTVSISALPGNMSNLDQMLVKFIALSPAKKYPLGYARPNDGLAVAPWSSSKVASVVASGNGATTTWYDILHDLVINKGMYNIEQTDSVGYDDYRSSGVSYDPDNEAHARMAIAAVLQDLIDDYVAAGSGNSPFASPTTTIPSLVTDMAGFYYQVYNFLKNEINTYNGQSFAFINDSDYTALQGAFTSL
jgi:hypothetical protein